MTHVGAQTRQHEHSDFLNTNTCPSAAGVGGPSEGGRAARRPVGCVSAPGDRAAGGAGATAQQAVIGDGLGRHFVCDFFGSSGSNVFFLVLSSYAECALWQHCPLRYNIVIQ